MIKQDSYTKAEDEVQKETIRLIDIGLPQGKNKVNSNSKASNSKVCWPWQMQDATKDGSLSINYGPYKYGGGCSSEILNWTPKGDRSGRGPSFFWPLKETMLKHRQYVYLNIVLLSILNETFTAKYDGILPRTP